MSPDELNDTERRLAAWRPADAPGEAAMLYAAGRASALRGAWRWPTVSGGLAVFALALGAWGWSERSARLATVVPTPTAPMPAAEPARSAGEPAQWELRRAWERNPDAPPPLPDVPASPELDGPVLRAFGAAAVEW